MEKHRYFQLTAQQSFEALDSSQKGMSAQQAEQRLQEYGSNELPLTAPTPAWIRFLSQFRNVLIYVLIASALVSAAMQHYVDSGVIVAVVFINAIVGFLQEGKAESALLAIMSMTRTSSLVERDGVLITLDSASLVPGDVILLQAGDRVPADVRLFHSKGFRCDESALTGEAQPVSKHTEPLPDNTILAERKNMAFMGTMATYGMARGLVIATASATEIGQVSTMVGQVEMPVTPLQRQLKQFAIQLSVYILIIAALTTLLGILLHDYALTEMLQAAIGIAVAAIPEGLPAIVTITLAIGVQRMAKNRALVRRLPAVEVLGSVDIICSDKTGTLTANAMTVREVQTATESFRISGEGYNPKGHIESQGGIDVMDDTNINDMARVAVLCNEASLVHNNNDWTMHGDPTEGALLSFAMKLGFSKESTVHKWPRIDVLPFESDRRYMASLHHNDEGQLRLMVKGAPEKIFQYATAQISNTQIQPFDQSYWESAAHNFAKKGMRVLALAFRHLEDNHRALQHGDVEEDLVLIGLVGISDPPRREAIDSIASCHSAGITVKMITGDNPVTAQAIGRELGLKAESVLTGAQIDTMSAQEVMDQLEKVDIIARASPANKLQIVSALQDHQHVVSMTGDGVNDAPALKKADIGVAMGKKGTDAAKEAADFVLTDDNFATIARAIAEGRAVYDNIVKSIIFILPTNLAEALIIISAITLGQWMPITPAQILWVNMITAVTLALALAFESPESNIMLRPPRPYRQALLSLSLIIRMLVVGISSAVIVFSLFYYYQEKGASIEYARTVSINTLVMIEVFYLFNCRFLSQSIFSREFFSGSQYAFLAAFTVISIQVIFTYLPVSQAVFGLRSIGFEDWVKLAVCAAPIFLIVEAEKRIQKIVFKNQAKA